MKAESLYYINRKNIIYDNLPDKGLKNHEKPASAVSYYKLIFESLWTNPEEVLAVMSHPRH